MKRFFAVALLLATLIACGKKEEEAAPEAPSVTTPAVVPESPPASHITAEPAAASAPEVKTPPAEAEEKSADKTYTVAKGDTLYEIARKHGLDYRDLARWNGIKNPGRIHIGQKLRLTAPE